MSDDSISDALNMIPYGFYTLTSKAGDDVNVMVMNWFTQVSFEPQHIAIGLDNGSYTFGLVEKGKVLGVNIFNKKDKEAVKPFAKSRAKRPDKLEGLKYSPAPVTGVPVLDAAAAYLECEVVQMVDTGSGHHVVIAKVVGAGVRKPGKPKDMLKLVDVGWSYSG
jgi:flavin reductase (DIM6/NTAB) family NADH-FMN oxidoreductase RutF